MELYPPDSTNQTNTDSSEPHNCSSILPPVPAGYRRIPEHFKGENYISVGAFPPGVPRKMATAHGVGSLFFDADAADWYQYERIALDSPEIERVTEKEANKQVKAHLHQMPQEELDDLLNEHLGRVLEVLAWLDLTPTYITRSGYGHHIHLWLDRWYTGPEQDQARTYTESVIDAVERELGYGFLDPSAALGGPQLCRDLGMQNCKSDRPQPVRIVGGGAK